MIFSVRRPQYFISHTKSQRLPVTRHRGGAKVQVTGHTKKQLDTGQNCSGLTFYYTKIKEEHHPLHVFLMIFLSFKQY